MTEQHQQQQSGHAPAAHPAKPEDRPGYQEFPKALYREADPPAAPGKVEELTVSDKKAEQEARGEGYLDGAELEKQHAEHAKAAKSKK